VTDDIQTKQNIIVQMRKDAANAAFKGQSSGPPIWLICFTDVIALMLTFFVLLYSMTNPDPEKWDRKIGITEYAQADFSGARNFAGSSEGINLDRLSYNPGEDLDYLQAVLAEVITEADKRFLTIERNDNNVLMVFNAVDPDNVALQRFLNRLTPTLNSLDNQLAVIADGGEKANFPVIQQIASMIIDNGYRRHIVLEMSDAPAVKNAAFILAFQPDDGRRIIR
jgi:flagellar motor protein MotB